MMTLLRYDDVVVMTMNYDNGNNDDNDANKDNINGGELYP